MKLLSSSTCHSGKVQKYTHFSEECQINMQFNIFLPKASPGAKFPGLFFLSALNCALDDSVQWTCGLKKASQLGLCLIFPDTSPRDTGIEGENEENVGSGASFYVDATEPKWAKHFRMYSYITKELTQLMFANFPIDPSKVSIFGLSMGGHGALTIALRNSNIFKCCSAFAPVCNPIKMSAGKKAYTQYLGTDIETWKIYDATELLKELKGVIPLPILITQGDDDEFMDVLLYDNFLAQSFEVDGGHPLLFEIVEGYDHSFFFVQSFIDRHLEFHAKHLGVA